MEKRAVLFCSSIRDIDPVYHAAARELTRALCADGWTIVTGGSWRGTMGEISEEASQCGGRHVGVVPRFMEPFASDKLTELVWTDTMSQRKEKMREGTSLAVALPGGIGTLDELAETLVLSKLGRYEGRIAVLDIGGFYAPLKDLLRHFVDTGMLQPEDRDRLFFAETTEDLMTWVRNG